MKTIIIGTLIALSIIVAPRAQACDAGSYYSPQHEICQNTPPAYTPPGYGWPPQNGGSNYGPSYPSQFGH